MNRKKVEKDLCDLQIMINRHFEERKKVRTIVKLILRLNLFNQEEQELCDLRERIERRKKMRAEQIKVRQEREKERREREKVRKIICFPL